MMAHPTYFRRKHKRALIEIIAAAVLLAVAAITAAVDILPDAAWLTALLYLPAYLVIGRQVVWKALRNMLRGQVFDENFLMTLATVGAFVIDEYPEAVFVMLFYRVGELFEELAVGRSRASIAALMDIRPDCAHPERPEGVVTVDPSDVAVGEIIVISPGERVPLDGTVVEGTSTLDTAALTGESLPRETAAGDGIVSGCVNLTGVLRVRVTKPYGQSTVARILELVENAGEHKSRSEHFITRFARYYTPAVVGAAVLLAVIPPLYLGAGEGSIWREWIYRAMSFLVISCPCALVISVPLSFFGGIGGASKRGILVKGSGYLEALASCDTLVLDKTGTLTEGRFAVTAISPAPGFSVDELIALTAAAELRSSHPIARALVAACDPPSAESEVPTASVEEHAGLGVAATVMRPGVDALPCPHRVCVGNAAFMQTVGAEVPSGAGATDGSTVYVAVDGRYAGRITVGDRVKGEAPAALSDLRRAGVRRIVMLTGDTEAVARTVAESLAVDEYHAGLLPTDKVTCLEALLVAPGRRGKLAFVGDGINDAPVLARADVGIAMGAMGSDAAIEAADVVLMDDRLSGLPTAMHIARRTLQIVRQNIVFALAVKAAVLVLGALGMAGLWLAVFADVGVAVLAILNAMRALQ